MNASFLHFTNIFTSIWRYYFVCLFSFPERIFTFDSILCCWIHWHNPFILFFRFVYIILSKVLLICTFIWIIYCVVHINFRRYHCVQMDSINNLNISRFIECTLTARLLDMSIHLNSLYVLVLLLHQLRFFFPLQFVNMSTANSSYFQAANHFVHIRTGKPLIFHLSREEKNVKYSKILL